MSDATLAGLIDDAIFCFKHDVDSAQVLALIDRLAPRLERMGEDSSRLLQARRHIVGDGQYGAGDSGDVAVTQPGAVIWLERLALRLRLGLASETPPAPPAREDAAAAAPVGKDGDGAEEAPWPALMSASDLARRLGMGPDAVNSFLYRHRRKRPFCCDEVPTPRKNEPRLLFRTADVVPSLKQLRDKRK